MTSHDKIKEFAAATKPKKTQGDQTASVNITGSGNTIVIGDNVRHIGQPVPLEHMTDEEFSAFKNKRWDGVERRDPSAEDAPPQQKKRATDVQEHALYYVSVALCFLVILGWTVFAWKFG